MTTALDHAFLVSSFDRDDRTFDSFATASEARFLSCAPANTPLFTTNAPDLYEIYLDSFPAAERQHHNCHCCRQFIQRYGHLVVIDEHGEHASAIWDAETAPEQYKPIAMALARAVDRAKVDGVFVSNEKVYGTPVTGEWHHFAVRPHPARVHKDRVLSAYQAMAQKNQDFGTLSRGIVEFNLDVVRQALGLLEAETLYRSEKVVGPAKFLAELHDRIGNTKGERRKNLIWKAVATAPVGFCTPRSSMVGTLLDDIAAGMSFSLVKARFASKMDPLQYQRPQAPARVGNIREAEKVVEKLGIVNSLKRRYARLDEMKLLWSPKAAQAPAQAGGVFGHLLNPSTGKTVVSSGPPMTWIKFAATVLPKAERMQIRIESRMNFCGVLTAVDPDAPPILQWDHEAERNPVSWYVYSGGSHPSTWGLVAASFVDVTGVSLKPSMWGKGGEFNSHGNGAIFILDGARDQRGSSLGLFPECLKSELHSIRSTIEAYSRAGTPEDREDGSANGLLIGDRTGITVRVKTALGVTDHHIDRWD